MGKVKHGHAPMNRKSPTYEVWKAMKKRCFYKNDKSYRLYSERGITVCPEWMEFPNFLRDMGVKPKGLSIDRINNDGNYEPGNCRWATWAEQNRNKRNIKFVTFSGETMCVADWAKRLGVGPNTLGGRFRAGWDIERALTTPVRKP